MKGQYDTGADIKCINVKFFGKMPVNKSPVKININVRSIKTAFKNVMQTKGTYCMDFKIRVCTVKQNVQVFHCLNKDLIFGMDFIEKNHYDLMGHQYHQDQFIVWTQGHLKL